MNGTTIIFGILVLVLIYSLLKDANVISNITTDILYITGRSIGSLEGH